MTSAFQGNRAESPSVRCADLGALSGEVLVYGGPYSNFQATQAVFARADALTIPPARRICTGDVVAYCADAVATADLVRRDGGNAIAGNCERQLSSGAGDCGCGFEDGTVCDRLSEAWYAHAKNELVNHDDLLRWFAGLPDIATFLHAGRRAAVLHGGVTDISRFFFSTSSDAEFAEELEALQRNLGAVDLVLAGHSGLPFDRTVDGVRWVNAGAIGMPAHDGASTTWFVILGADGTVAFEQLDYDHVAAAKAMQAAGLTQGYHTSLSTGYWPSEDVLPTDLRRQSRASG